MKGLCKKELAALAIIDVAGQLLAEGRPRKRPFQPRPTAIDWKGQPACYRRRRISRFSLQGAVKRAAYQLRGEFSKGTLDEGKKLAEKAIGSKTWPGSRVTHPLDVIDDHWSDDREIRRMLGRAARSISKGRAA